VAAGEFVAENAALRGDITLLDSDPYEQGWLYQVRGQPEPSAVDARAYTEVLNAAIDAMLGGRELDDVDE
jgi:glycine cleavage system H lipoate-binding protein